MVNTRKNKDFNPNNCPVTFCLNIIGGKWKPLIINMIHTDCNRHSMLLRAIPAISKQTLTNQLRELESDGIIERKVFAEIPPRVEYSVTAFGSTLFPIIDLMKTWGLQNMGNETPR